MRCVVLGAAGQLGGDLVPRLPGDVVTLNRAQADLTQTESLTRVLAELHPAIEIGRAHV